MTRPAIVCLCGSTRFYREFQEANYRETMEGRIVLTVGFYPHSSDQAHGEGVACSDAQKIALDKLHFRKIDLADEVLILNVGGYVGSSTRNELAHARRLGKRVRWLEPDKAIPEPDCDRCRNMRAYMATDSRGDYIAVPCGTCRPEVRGELMHALAGKGGTMSETNGKAPRVPRDGPAKDGPVESAVGREDATVGKPGPPIAFLYRNHRGEVATRRVVPVRLWLGTTEWHPEPGWLIEAYDLDRRAVRDFALSGIIEVYGMPDVRPKDPNAARRCLRCGSLDAPGCPCPDPPPPGAAHMRTPWVVTARLPGDSGGWNPEGEVVMARDEADALARARVLFGTTAVEARKADAAGEVIHAD